MKHTAVRAIILNDGQVLAMHRNKFGMEYYTLIGGGVDVGEDNETALRRELREETGLEVGNVRLVFIEDAGALYGEQYVYLCEYKGGEPKLSIDSEEAKISAMSKNVYTPVWLPLGSLKDVTFRSGSIRDALLEGVRSGFPETPQTLA
jgi:ADP-ribose pyrophosphatase YjhB (NUDIX family)